MNLQNLCQLLTHPKPGLRMMSIHIIRMVDEVQALDAIQAALPDEQSRKIAHEFEHVANYLLSLKDNNYNTIAAICQQFNVYSDILRSANPEKFEVVCRMLKQLQEQSKNATIHNRRLYMTLMFVSRVLGDVRRVNPDDLLPKLKKRHPPIVPTNKDISRWLEKLKSDNSLDRDHALHQLAISNNPASLQYMAHTYMHDKDHKVREVAKRLGRQLYWNRIYYEMEQDGTLDSIIKEFSVVLRLIDVDEPLKANRNNIAEILAQAETERRKRGLDL